jgi:nucleoside-diphosphate-sugar epimerase/CBS domain-containing protein
MSNYSKHIINENTKIKDVIKKINDNHIGIIAVQDNNNKFRGILSDSDIRRLIIKGISLKHSIKNYINTNPFHLNSDYNQADVIKLITSKKFSELSPGYIPVLKKKKFLKFLSVIELKKENYILKKKVNNKNNNQNRVLIIGGAGYIGSILSTILAKAKYNVRIYDKFIYTLDHLKSLKAFKNIEIIKGDTRHIDNLFSAFQNIDTVVHLAEFVGDPLCSKNPEKTYEINYLATNIIANLCKTFYIKKYIYISSCSVYGQNKNNNLLNEDSELNPQSIYAQLKLNCEEAIFKNIDEDFNFTVLRLGTVFGLSLRQRFDLVVNLFCYQAIKNKKISIINGNQWRPFVHIKDVAYAIKKVIEDKTAVTKQKVYNVIGENITIENLARIFKKFNNKIELIQKKEIADLRNYKVSAEKIYTDIKFKPKYNLHKGIKELINFIKKNKIKNINKKKYHNFMLEKFV